MTVMNSASNTPPSAQKIPHEITIHGQTRVDDYAWLKDENWQQVMHDPSVLDADIRAYLEAENDFTAGWMNDTHDLQRTLYTEMRGRIKEDDSTVPDPDGPYAYYVRYVDGGQHPKYCRRGHDVDAPEMILLDGDTEAEGTDYYKIGAFGHSPDHMVGAYAEDRNGSEIFRIKFRRLGDGADLDDVIDNTSADFEWAEDGKTLFYTVLDDNHRPSKVMRHAVGTPTEDDVMVFEEPDPGFFIGLAKTESRAFILIDSHDHETSEVRMIPSEAP